MIDYRAIHRILLFIIILLGSIGFISILWAVRKYPPPENSKKYDSKIKFLASLPFIPIPKSIAREDKRFFLSYRKRLKIVVAITLAVVLVQLLAFIILILHSIQIDLWVDGIS